MSHLSALQPLDEHNRKLQSNVHPPEWENPVPDGVYNMVVIGGGTAGLVTAAGAAGLGAKVALIERGLLGGDCLNVGCVPSKAILAAARRAAQVRDAEEFGIRVPEGVRIDFAAVMERMRRLRSDISPHDSARRFTEMGIDVFFGQGKFTGTGTIDVNGTELKFKKATIATGARAAAPTIPGLEEVEYLTNETLFSLTTIPKRFGVIGAGPVGVEMAQSFARLGSEVYLVESNGGILPKDDPEAGAAVRRALEKDGVTILSGGRKLRLEKKEGAEVKMIVDGENGYCVEVDRILVAVGRAPNVEGLGMEDVGIEFSKEGVSVNERLETTVKGIFAAGDVCSKYQFTHAADFLARTVIGNALFHARGKAGDLVIPWATYSEPEVGHVGVTPTEAGESGLEIDTFRQDLDGVDRAILSGETEGFVKIHVRKGSDRIVGATVVGPNAGDMIGEITLAMTQGIGLGKLKDVIHPYPTVGEAIRKVGDAYNRTRLTPTVKRWMDRWFAWSRR